jgi:hypothetical protein
MDPQRKDTGYPLERIRVPAGSVAVPSSAGVLRQAFSTYGRSMRTLLAGYYIVDRNYTWHFHNELFVRHTPLLPNYRAAALHKIDEARSIQTAADAAAAVARGSLTDDNPVAALLDELRAYASFNFDRAARLETMSAEFERTPAGLQHAAHLYEGEGKFVGIVLAEILAKHKQTLEAREVRDITAEFAADGKAIADAYASPSRVVCF